MPARSAWKGYLKLSLVSIPVKAYSITSGEGSPIRLNQLHSVCKSRIKNVKTCPIHGAVNNDEIVSGYEYAKDQYVLIDVSEISKLRTEDQKAITIQEFIKQDAIDPIYWTGTTLILMPDGPIGQKPYALLHAGMMEKGRYAVAQIVWHGKEQIVMIRPIGALLAMCILSYDYEISKPGMFEPELVNVEMVPEEVKLVNMLIDASTPLNFDFAKYTDIYNAKLTELINMKVDGQDIVAAPAQEHTRIINLMDALKQSLDDKLRQGSGTPEAAPVPESRVAQGSTAPHQIPPLGPVPFEEPSQASEPPPIMAPSKKPRASRKKKSS